MTKTKKELPKILRPAKTGKISRRQAIKAVKKAMKKKNDAERVNEGKKK
jgi:hypothetical protein